MPLLTSPIDGSEMKQINRFGVELDVCPTSGGIWLDKGELEKIMALIKQAAEEDNSGFSNNTDNLLGKDQDSHVGGKFEQHYYKDTKGGKNKKESALSQILDIFDF